MRPTSHFVENSWFPTRAVWVALGHFALHLVLSTIRYVYVSDLNA